jgi:hypothetical protein
LTCEAARSDDRLRTWATHGRGLAMKRLLTLLVVLSVVLMSCGDNNDAMAPSAKAEAFVGTDIGVMTPISDEVTDDGTREIREHFSTTIEASDERVTGTQELDTVTVVLDPTEAIPDGVMWWVEDDVITNDGGTWRSDDGYGVVDMVGVHPLAERVSPFNYGVIRYVGEGGYAGLELTMFFTGTNESGGVAGWIEQS